ncbi:MAG: adaptor protein MecA [Defluviitaleaceae bacterium]|nr:adaptor protein MecA [Defluviitaleaceae bacterium]
MKIERISETQMKFVLMQTDLEARDIKISELSHSSDKTQRLFKEIIQLAQDEGVFSPESTQYLVEAMKVGVDSLAVIVTKISQEDLEKQYSLVPAAKGHCRYKRNKFIDPQEYPGEDSYSVFSFADLDMAATAAEAISLVFNGESGLYKHDGRYYLWILNETEDNRTTADLEAILREFGQKHISSVLSKQYLTEHGSEIIADNAVSKLMLYSKNI